MNNTKRIFSTKALLACLFSIGVYCSASAQIAGLKSNLLYDATGTINLGIEVGLSKQFTLDISSSLNPWTYNHSTNTKLKHLLVQPELRYWLCERFAGHFFGAHLHWARFNAGALDLPLGLTDNSLSKYRYAGNMYGAGVVYGYQWFFKSRWAVEAELGVGYTWIDYKKFGTKTCCNAISRGRSHYVGPTKAAVSLIFFIK